MSEKQPTCKERWAHEKNERIRDLRRLLKAAHAGEDSALYKRTAEDIGTIYEYGLVFDYVAPGTFEKQLEGYWRYQLSWGGPSDEFRFYSSDPHSDPYRITYVFLDWFDGYERKLTGKDEALLLEYWQDFEDMGVTQGEYERAMED